MDEQVQFDSDDSCHSLKNTSNSCNDIEGTDNEDYVTDSDVVSESFNFMKTKVITEVDEEDAEELASDSQELIDTSLKETTNIPKEKPRTVGGVRCSAIACFHLKNVNPCAFLPFPKEEDLKQRWVLAMQRCHVDDDGKLNRNRLWEPKSQHRLCSCHFSQPVNFSDKPEDYSDLMPDTFEISEETAGKRKSRTKFRLTLNDDVISSRTEDDNLLPLKQIQSIETAEEEYATGMGYNTAMKAANICSAPGCDHSRDRFQCTLLKFPVDLEWRRRWVIAMERCYVNENGEPDRGRLWEPNRHHKLCTCHFSFPVEIKKKDPELRHIVPDLFTIPDEDDETCDNKWAKCHLRITGVEDFEFSSRYIDFHQEKNRKEKEKKAEKDKVIITQTFNQTISNTVEGNDRDQVTKVPVDKNLNVCSALTCTHKIYDKSCSFISFPKDPVWKERWVIALQRCHVSREGIPDPHRLWEPTEQHKLCACHFSVVINTRTRRRGYNHIIPDLVSFPSKDEVSQEVEVWMRHRLDVTDEHRARLILAHEEVLNMTVEETSFHEQAATSMQDSFSLPAEAEEIMCDTSDSNHLYGLLTKPKNDQVNVLPFQDSLSGNLSASQISLKLPLFVKYHSNGKDSTAVEADSKDKQFHSHCAAVGCLHRVSQKICSFLSFPKAHEWRQRWAFALRRCYVDEHGKPDLQRLWEPRDHHRLCTCHFSFPINAKTRKTGYNHVLPDVLSFPEEENDKHKRTGKETKKETSSNRNSSGHTNLQVPIKIEPGVHFEVEKSYSLNHHNTTSGLSSFSQTNDETTENDLSTAEDGDWLASIGPAAIASLVTSEQQGSVEGSVEESRGGLLQKDDNGHTVCSAPGCQHRRGENYCSFVSFPKYPELREKWVASIHRYQEGGDGMNGERKLWEPGENHKLCVCHFSKPINVRSRAPEIKLIVPDILDTSSFIPIPTSKVAAGNKQVFTLKRVDANLITKEDVARWNPHEMEMFLVKNKRKKDFKSRQQLLDHVWTYIFHKRNKSTQTMDQTEPGPAPKRQKMSDGTPASRQSGTTTVGQNHRRGSSWFDTQGGQCVPGENLLSSIMQKVISDYHEKSPVQQGPSREESDDVKPSSSRASVPLPVGFIDMRSHSSFQVDNNLSKSQTRSSPASNGSDTLQNILMSSSNHGNPRRSARTVCNNKEVGNQKILPPTTETNSSLLKSALTVQNGDGDADSKVKPSKQAFHNLAAVESDRLDDLEDELLEDTETEYSHKEKLNQLKAELEQLKHSKSGHRSHKQGYASSVDSETEERDGELIDGRRGGRSPTDASELCDDGREYCALLSTTTTTSAKDQLKVVKGRNTTVVVGKSDLSAMVIQQVKMYVCEFCDMEFKKKAPLFAHKTKWHREQNVSENWTRLGEMSQDSVSSSRLLPTSSQNAANEDVLMCRECGDECDSLEELEEHMASHAD